MKYIIFTVFALVIFCLCLPIWLITWKWDDNENGWYSIIDGLSDVFGID
jgi:hypothetical protein